MSVRIALAQINLLVGDIKGNTEKVIASALVARDQQRADIVVFPELCLTGYPPEDLLLRPALKQQVVAAVQHICEAINGITCVIGAPWHVEEKLYNAALVIRDGEIEATYLKQCLPNYSVFDEKRYFSAGHQACTFTVNGVQCAVSICEDIWQDGPVQQAVQAGAKILLSLNASPYTAYKHQQRKIQLEKHAKKFGLATAYVNLVGGQDELVFDGQSMFVDAAGNSFALAPAFEEVVAWLDVDAQGVLLSSSDTQPEQNELAVIYKALVLAVRDYVQKNKFDGAILGLSGGIDSALTLAIAVDALGAKNVQAVMMPYQYTADISVEDARLEAQALGIEYSEIPIKQAVTAFNDLLGDAFKGLAKDTTEENIQARCRGVLLMALSNKKRRILLTTGNKSEMAVGYATLYGDMAGGFAALKDVSKTLVYELANYRNTLSAVIPERVITRPPSAELAPDQKDSDSLPDYAVLDRILERYVEQDQSADDIIAAGFERKDVERAVYLVDMNEYKRRQAPPGVKISARAFGRDRRYPITSG